MAKYISTCIANHQAEFSGPFARLRNRIWWMFHEWCEDPGHG